MKNKFFGDTTVILLLSLIVIVFIFSITPWMMLNFSRENSKAKIDSLYIDNDSKYIRYHYLNIYNDKQYFLRKILSDDEYNILSLHDKKDIDIVYSQYFPKYPLIRNIGDSIHKSGFIIIFFIAMYLVRLYFIRNN